MKYSGIIFVVFILISACFADEFKVHVQNFDEELDASPLQSKDVEVSNQLPPPKSLINQLPSPQVINGLIKQAGLDQELSALDQMDKDMLMLKIQRSDLEYVKRKFPKIDLNKINHLKTLLEKK